ncbi:MAG: hypothetical protein H0V85_01870 [Thermoleophilaceae bacterium]|nr:hypothetical protein [Thermoleophilaceae bacterium]
MDSDAPVRLARAREALAGVEPFDGDHVEAVLRTLPDELGVKGKQVFQPIRVAISGGTVSPGIFESLAALGRDESLARIDAALERAGSSAGATRGDA